MPAKLTQEQFLAKAYDVHGDTYDYSKTVYDGRHKNVTIICPIHGDFQQTPHNHLKGKGCWACAGVKPLTQEEFVAKSIAVHGKKYDYSKAKYVRNNQKVIIICPIHGEFEQVPMSHMKGIGCPDCGNESRRVTVAAYHAQAKTGGIISMES